MKIVIIGGVAAGAKAAAKIRRMLDDESEVIIYTDDTHVSYSACGIPYYVEGNFEDYRTLLVRSPEEFAEDGVQVFLEHRVSKILPETKQVLVENMKEKSAFLTNYDKLIIATGASPIVPPIKNNCFKNVFTVRKIEDAINIRAKLRDSKRAVIIGGGYIGLEMLEAFVKNNVYTVLVERGNSLMPALDEEMSLFVKEQLELIRDNKFEIITNEAAVEFCGDSEGVISVETSTGRVIDCDLVIICVGVKPNVQLAIDAGIQLGETGAIKVNRKMETSISDIYACGDCVEENFLITNTPIWMPLGSNANKEGRCAAINAAGGEDEFLGVLASAVTRCMKFTISMTGLTESMAKKHNIETVSAIVTKYDKVGYMPDANNITLKLVAEKKTGKLLGGQSIGSGDGDKRINTLTAALLGGLTVREFERNDLTYAPPFSPTIDPLLNVSQILLSKLEAENSKDNQS